MGGTLSREKLLKSTEPTQLLMDEALRFMMDKLTRDDLRKLREPSECSKYILLIGDAFEQYFQSVDVIPLLKKEQKGRTTIYFQKASVLTGASSTGNRELDEKLRADRLQICRTIAYFFTRLFQIVTALSYSIFDDARIRQVQAAAPAQALGGPALLRGGAWYDSTNTIFDELFGPYLTYVTTQENTKYYDMNIPNNVTGIRISVEFVQNSPDFKILFTGRKEPNGTLSRIRLYCTIAKRGELVSVIIRKMIIKIGYDAFELTNMARYDKKFTRLDFKKFGAKFTTVRKIYRNEKIELLPKVLESLYVYIYNNRSNIKNNVPPDSLPLFWSLERTRDEASSAAAAAARDDGLLGLPGMAAAPVSTRVSVIPAVATCIARSLQLLQVDVAAPMGGRAAMSYICEPKFMSGSIPAAGESIMRTPGMKSLEMLFSVFRDGMSVAMTAENKEYMKALEIFNAVYGDNATRMEDVRNKKQSGQCATTGPIAVTSSAQKKVLQKGVDSLTKIQVEHAKKVAGILGQLFVKDKSTGGKLGINPQLLSIGITGLDMIANFTRDVLVDYYGRCEATYQSAVAASGLLQGKP
jgi:hypothetical protein